ncbi:MAG: hypothetical protein MH825_08690 [Cyanobacteria bacterium]|nr:hypothetical protein [Cyanobacteriota bacterium]
MENQPLDDDFEDSDDDLSELYALLPGWFAERMVIDVWSFGLLMVTGDIIAISSINKITQDASGALWLDVTLLDQQYAEKEINGHKLFYAPTSRTESSVNVAHIVAAFELADT